MIIVWDEPKRLANRAKHGLDFINLTDEFFAGSIVVTAKNSRFKAVRRLDDGLIAVILPHLGAKAFPLSA